MLSEIQLYKISKGKTTISTEPLAKFKILNYDITDKGIKFISELSKEIEVLFINGQITASSDQIPPIYGNVFIDAISFENPYDIKWTWGLLPQDISVIEAQRQYREFQVFMSLKGICRDSKGELFSFFGGNFTTIGLSEWYKVLDKYTIANNAAIQVPPSLFIDRSWSIAAGKLENANNLLERGETRLALVECLSVIEAYVSNPYNEKNWIKCIDDNENEQRRDGIISLFSGISTFLNKIGHHRSKNERDENDELVLMPLDHYEAEIIKLITQLVVVYLERLKVSGILKIDSDKLSN